MYEMKQEYFTGIEQIDTEHAMLFTIADEVYGLLNDQFIPDKFDYIVEVLEKLKNYAIYHFENEEAYMEEMEYKRILSQKVSHNDFVSKLEEFSFDKIDENQKEALLEIIEFLNEWLVDHILKEDLLIVEA